jgi:hypothetical protein
MRSDEPTEQLAEKVRVETRPAASETGQAPSLPGIGKGPSEVMPFPMKLRKLRSSRFTRDLKQIPPVSLRSSVGMTMV